MNKNFTINLPEEFVRNITGLYGAKGEKWLEELFQTITRISRKWHLTVEKNFPNLSFNYVAPCADKTGKKYVLKIGVPEEDAPILNEKRALQAFDGNGAIKLVKFDEEFCAILLERATPGQTLDEVCGEDFEKAVEIAISVMKKLPRDVPDKSEFINLETWIAGLNRAIKADFEITKVIKAQKFFAELIEPFEKKILLHGDIHFDNILSARREPFLLIDPKGIVGEIGYEIAVFLNDLAGWTNHSANRKAILDSAVAEFSRAFAVGETDLRKWSAAFAVLSAWWMMEDFGQVAEEQILRAEIWNV